MLQVPKQSKKRQSSKHVASQLSKLAPILPSYISRQFLQSHSLYSNLFSSQNYSLTSSSQTDIMNLFFSKQNLQLNQLYQFSYFHKRDKKMLLYFLILKFLKNQSDGGKSKLIIIENIQRINKNQLKSFLTQKNYGGNQKIVKDLDKRIVWYYSKNLTTYKFNLSYLSIQQQQDPFIKGLIICDINTFQTSDKPTQQKYYKKLPQNLLIFSLRRDIYDYKVIQKSPLNQFYSQQHGQDKYQLNDKITSILKKRYQICNHLNHVGINFIIPIQHLGMTTKSLDETYKTCLIRMMQDNSGYLQFTFKGFPFQVQTLRKITI